MAKEGGSWSAKVLAKRKVTDSVAWKAQVATAPDGAQFLVVRKFVTKKDGSEIATRDGISISVDAPDVSKQIDMVIGLLQVLKNGDSEPEGPCFYLVHKKAKRPFGLVSLEGRPSKGIAKKFGSAQEAKDYRAEHIAEKYQGDFNVKRGEMK